MNCDILKIVRGNDFATQMTITALDAGGNVIEDFSLEDSTDVVVKYTLAGESHTIDAYDYDIEGNDITIQWSDLALGKYGFEIEGKFNGYSWRSAARFIFQIVADNASANIPDGVLVNGVYMLNDWLRLLSGTGGGGKQVQADWTETDTNSPAYIQNKPTFKTINGEQIVGEGNIEVGGNVESVNGQIGEVVLDAQSVGAASAEDLQEVADDVATLQAAYEGLTQSDIVIGALPESGVANTIYRVPSTSSYSDYMWDGTQFVLMATYTIPADAGVYDISAEHSGASYDNLTAALGTNGANVPSAVRSGGMSIKYIENVYADFKVLVTSGLENAPTGTLLASASSVTDGIYKATQLTDFATLPSNVGDSLVYYIAVIGETTTYTQWLITKRTADHTKYVQWKYNAVSVADADFSNTNNWEFGDLDKRLLELEENAGRDKVISYPFGSPNYYIKQDGSVATNASARSTGYVEVKEGDVFYYSGRTMTTSRAVAAYRYNGTTYDFVAILVGITSTVTNNILVVIPQGLGITHILAHCNSNYLSDSSLKQTIDSNLGKIEKEIGNVGEIKAYLGDDRTVFPTGHYVKDPTGTWVTALSIKAGFFDLKAGDKLTIYDYAANSSSSVAILAKKITDTPTFEIIIGGDMVAHPLIEYVATEDMTVCVSGYNGPRLLTIESSLFAGINGSIDYLKTAQLQNEQKLDEIDKYDLKLGYMFNNIAVIGDSMSVGSISTEESEAPNSRMNASWLSILAKRWGCISRMHYATGGSGSYSWLNNDGLWGLGAMLRDSHVYNCYLIAYGHNDDGSNYSGVGEATDTAATVTISGTTPSCASGNTFCAYYKAIIDQIRAKAPHAMIFCLSEYDNIVKSKQDGAYRQAIIDVANWYYAQGDHLVYHLETGGVPNSNMSLGSHYSTIGYFHIAMRVDQEANKAIYEHMSDMQIKEFGIYNNGSDRYLEYVMQ